MADMGESEPAFLIAAVREAVKRNSIRAVAAQAGMSHGGLFNLVTGRTRVPFGTTVNKLRSWYLREGLPGGEGLTPDVVLYLVEQLVASVDGERRRAAVRELLGALERIFDSRSTPRPKWLQRLASEYPTRSDANAGPDDSWMDRNSRRGVDHGIRRPAAAASARTRGLPGEPG
jgi:hypothetical protein